MLILKGLFLMALAAVPASIAVEEKADALAVEKGKVEASNEERREVLDQLQTDVKTFLEEVEARTTTANHGNYNN